MHSGCRVSRKSVASTSLLLWLFVTIPPLVQAGSMGSCLSVVWQHHKEVSKESPGAFGVGLTRAVLSATAFSGVLLVLPNLYYEIIESYPMIQLGGEGQVG